MEKIAQGAEAIIYHDGDKIIKERPSKGYRIKELDLPLRKSRTRREAKVLQKLDEANFPAPKLLSTNDKDMIIEMSFIDGEKVRDLINEKTFQELGKELGQKLGLMHSLNIIHGDLTTSNMILANKTNEINFIDFGLSFFSEKAEDKAVDLFLLDRALESKHYQFHPAIFDYALEGYKTANPDALKVLERFEEVIKRGRNKKK